MSLLLPILAISLALTLVLELGFALAWGLRGWRELTVVCLVNCLTNPVVVTLTYTLPHGQRLVLLLELGAVLVEWLCYRACSERLRRPLLFSLCANGFSYGAGLLINILF